MASFDWPVVSGGGGGGSSDTLSSSTSAGSDGRDGAVMITPTGYENNDNTGGSILIDDARYSSAIGIQNIDLCFYANAELPINGSSVDRSAVVGGAQNRTASSYTGLFAGYNNEIKGNANYAFIGGGATHVVEVNAQYSGILGGRENTVSGQYTSVVGGYGNTSQGTYGIAGGQEAYNVGNLSLCYGYYVRNLNANYFVLGAGPVRASSTLKDYNRTFQVNMKDAVMILGRVDNQAASGVPNDVNEFRIQTTNDNQQSNYIGFRSSPSMTTSYVIEYPTAVAAAAGQILQVTGIASSVVSTKWATQLWVARNDAGNSGTSLAVDFDEGNVQTVTLTDNVTFTFSNSKDGAAYTLILKQDATGSRTVTWPASVKWPGGSAPTLSTAANAIDIVTIVYDGTNHYANSALNFS